MKTIILKEQYTLSKEEKIEIAALNEEFYKNDHELLNGKRISKSLADKISDLYYKHLGSITFDWGNDLLKVELKDLKNDSFTGNNSNKKYWVMAYMLDWLVDLDELPMEDFFYNALTKREAYRQLLLAVYRTN